MLGAYFLSPNISIYYHATLELYERGAVGSVPPASSSPVGRVSLREVRPRGRHLRVALVAEREMALLLIILDAAGFIHGHAVAGVITELARRRRLEVRGIRTELVVRANLVQRILVAKYLVLGEGLVVALALELLQLLRAEVLRPAARVVPVRRLQPILLGLGDDFAVRIALRGELLDVDRVEAAVQLAKLVVRLAHLGLFAGDIKLLPDIIVLGVLALTERDGLVVV